MADYRVRGVLVPAALCGVLYRIAQVGAAERTSRDGWSMPSVVRELLVSLDREGRAWRDASALPTFGAFADESDSAPDDVTLSRSGERANYVRSTDGDESMTTAQTGEALGVTPQRVTQLLAAGALTGRKVGGVWLVEADSVRTYLERSA